MVLLVAATAGLIASLWLERLVEPRRAGFRRQEGTVLAVHTGLFLTTYALSAAVYRRPMLAAAMTLGLQLVIIVVSNAKRRVLREPLVYSDFALFAQALRHPRLYLPYLQALPAAGAVLAVAGVLAAGLALEAPIPEFGWAGWGLLAASLALVATASAPGARRVTLDPDDDARRLGLIASCWLYWLLSRQPIPKPDPIRPLTRRATESWLPDIVVVECESFFDPRALFPHISSDVLRHYDALCAEAESGRLTVPAWGAYTMRTEFAFLSGIAPARLGVHSFNPYQRFARETVPTIASRLKACGYRTLCVHPYSASFFGRDKLFPRFGFDAFIDAASFAAARREGAYVADAEVAGKIVQLLGDGGQPTFVFAITMENHGPLHLESAEADDARALYRRPPPPGYEDLTVYLRHLRNSDAMIGELAAGLRKGDGVLCVFGDHLPGMPEVYAAAAYRDPRTEYLIWQAGMRHGVRVDRAAEELAERVLCTAGFET